MNNRIELLLQYIKEDPGDPFPKYALALEYVKTGDDDAALTLMEDVAQTHPGYLPNYYHFGRLLEKGGNREKAEATYQKGIQLARELGDNHTLSELRAALDSMDE